MPLVRRANFMYWMNTCGRAKRGPGFKSKCARRPGNKLANQRRIHILALEELSIDGLGLAIVEITLRKRHNSHCSFDGQKEKTAQNDM